MEVTYEEPFSLSGEGGIFTWHFAQVYVHARIATQIVISQAIALLWLFVVLGGCLGLLGIGFSTVSAQPNAAPTDMYRPVTTIRAGKTIRYDRTPKRPSVFAITLAVVVALVALAVVWAQLGGQIAPTVPRSPSGHASALARRKDTKDTGDDDLVDPMSVGGADDELARAAHQWWIETAKKAGIDLTGFDPAATLAARVAWAMQAGLDIAAVLSRFSSRLQHSTQAQVQHNVEYAAFHKMYVPPEFICVDEAAKGRRLQRDGLDRVKAILKHRQAGVLLVFKMSRLLRTGYKSFQFINEEVVEEGLRAISTTQGIDTRNEKTWKALMYLHGMMDEMLLDTIADHCRAGLKTLFQQGFTTGAIPVGYRRVEVPNAPRTNRGLPRTMPQVDPEVAKLIKQHYEWIRDGMTIKEGWRRWVETGGPCDPRSTLRYMSRQAYRRLLSNPRYVGCWAFGRMKNCWSSKRDYNRQIEQPEADVAIYRCEELRILDDELFHAVQARLAEFKLGPRGPHKRKAIHLWDLITELYHCAHCKVRFHQAGANGKGMQCKRGDLCPCKSAVRRKEAVQAICKKLTELIQRDADLICRIICRSRDIDAKGDEKIQMDITSRKAKIQALTNKINDLEELSGQGSDEDRRRRKAMINAASAERATLQLEVTRLEKTLGCGAAAITPEQIREILRGFSTLLEDAAKGSLGEDVIYKAFSIFRRLTGGRIWVHVERRPGRKRTIVRGVFTPQLLRTVTLAANTTAPGEEPPAETVEVWLRKPPRVDAIADEVHQLMDVEFKSYREAAKILQEQDPTINSGNVWYSYRRWYQMRGLPVPECPYNNGQPRKSR